MHKTSPIDIDHALVDPRAVFGAPSEVLARTDLDASRKRQILERWRHDAIELQTADTEGMGGGEDSMLKRVSDALLALESETGVKAEHDRTITP